jgi:transposase
MDTTAPSTAQPGSRKGRPNYPTDFKLRLAQQACEPGVSVELMSNLVYAASEA